MVPFSPMVSLTGKPKKDQLTSFMQSMLDVGITSVLLYPRSGCEFEYLSDEWFECCRTCIEFARDNNMKIWLYDENNWPSGSCNGLIGRLDKSFLAKLVAVENGQIRMKYADPETAHFAVDILNPRAMEAFIRETHEKYAEHFSDYFGTVICGFFTDEPSFNYFCEPENRIKHEKNIPYYDGAWEDYLSEFGRDGQKDMISEHPDFIANWYSLLAKRFRTSFFDTIRTWCDSHSLKLTGHMMCDDDPALSFEYSGDVFSCLTGFSLPGFDDVHNIINTRLDLLFSQADVLRRSGVKEVMAEVFAMGPCSLSYAKKKRMVWYAASYGVNRFFPTVAQLDIRGNRFKSRFFHEFSCGSPDFVGAAELGRSAEKAIQYADKPRDIRVALKYPLEELGKAQTKENRRVLSDYFLEVIAFLTENQIPTGLVQSADEGKKYPVCLSVRDGILRDENSGRSFGSFDEVLNHVLTAIRRPVLVKEENGDLAKAVTVQCYTDGSYLIIDRENEPPPCRSLLIELENGQTLHRSLQCFGVITDQDGEHALEDTNAKIGEMTISHENKNFLRPFFIDSDTFEFEATDELEITVNRRTDADSGLVVLDGKELAFSGNASSLPSSSAQLYEESDVISLKKGKHKISCNMTDLAFLPAVIISGDMDSEGDLISRRSRKPKNQQFFGKSTVSFNVTLPDEDALVLTFDDSKLVCSLSTDGIPCGIRAFAPYEFPLPDSLRGRDVEIKLTLHSSAASMFGETARGGTDFCIHPSSPEHIGLLNPRICKEKK